MNKTVVILPVHKSFSDLSKEELLSIGQLKAVLLNYPVCIITGHDFVTEDYLRFFQSEHVFIERFDNQFFTSVKNYNLLCLSNNFYNRFKAFEYMLVYQSDSFVFRDELLFWTEKRFDFIGAPFHTDNSQSFDASLWTVGNGGFSLRSVNQCRNLLKRIANYVFLLRVLNKMSIKNMVTRGMAKLGSRRLFYANGISRNRYNEDYVFGVLSKEFMKHYNVAPLSEAIAFSFEAHPSELFRMNHNRLPFGCHGWEKYEPEFWKHFITASANSVSPAN